MNSTIWDVFSIVGTIAFALSGAIVAMEEEFDILGIFVLGFMTAFGGGAIRNVLIGLPMTALWSQGNSFNIALISMIIIIVLPNFVAKHWEKAGLITDAIGLAVFSIQGAIFATNLNQPISAIIVAAILTGTGGGVVRDLLAGRKPGVLRSEIYAGWSILAAVLIYFQVFRGDLGYYILAVIVVILRLIGVKRNWHLPKAKWEHKK